MEQVRRERDRGPEEVQGPEVDKAVVAEVLARVGNAFAQVAGSKCPTRWAFLAIPSAARNAGQP